MATPSELILRWCRIMEGSVPGKLLLRNIWHDWRTGRVPTTTVRAFLLLLARRWEQHQDLTPNHIVANETALKAFNELQQSLRTEIPPEEDGPALCQGVCFNFAPAPCSLLTELVPFLTQNIDRARASYAYDGLEPTYQDVEHLEMKSSLASVVKVDAKMPVRRPKPTKTPEQEMGWVTQTEKLTRLRDAGHAGDKLAGKLQGELGLLHHLVPRSGIMQYVEIVYPIDAFSQPGSARLAPPTFLDSTANAVFRSKVRADDGWGETAHLIGGGAGMPEAVHPAIPFAGAFRLRRVGLVNGVKAGLENELVLSDPDHPWQPEHAEKLANLCNGTEEVECEPG